MTLLGGDPVEESLTFPEKASSLGCVPAQEGAVGREEGASNHGEFSGTPIPPGLAGPGTGVSFMAIKQVSRGPG